jgi:pilus assembly protein Flp/PilA
MIWTYFKIKAQEETGASAIEYALIAGLIAVAIIAALQTLGTDLTDVFNTISTELKGVTNSNGG